MTGELFLKKAQCYVSRIGIVEHGWLDSQLLLWQSLVTCVQVFGMVKQTLVVGYCFFVWKPSVYTTCTGLDK